MNIFEQATRHAYRYESIKGLLTTEQLWDLPLTSKSGFDLDTVAKAVNAVLKESTEESFVAQPKAQSEFHQNRLDVIKHIIAVRLQETADVRARAERAAERAKLIDLLGKKQDAKLGEMTEEQIKQRLAELG